MDKSPSALARFDRRGLLLLREAILHTDVSDAVRKFV